MNKKNLILYTGLLLAGLFLGYIFFGGSDEPQSLDEHVEEAHTDEEGNIIYTCSMHPQVRQNEPGNCPICGMELIPADGGAESADNPYTITMTQASMKLAEIQTTPAVMEQAVSTVTLPGKIVVDERSLSKIPAHFHGRIEELFVNFTGEYISQGQKIARVYSPMLFTAQKELLEAYKNRNNNPLLYQAARNKLKNWKISDTQINRIIESGTPSEELDIISHKSGYVLALRASAGDHLDMGDIMYEISSLAKLWVVFEAYESDISGLKPGDPITFTIPSLPGQEFTSEITYINPYFDEKTRTVSVRTEIDNSDFNLKPGMFASGIIQSSMSSSSDLIIPRSAVMWTGKRSIVYVQVPNTETPTFEAREVVLGKRAGNFYVIESGLSEGEQVVTNGTFKIDSAAQLSDKLSMMNRNPGTGANRTGHEGHTMPVESPSSGGQEMNVQERKESSVPDEFRNQLKTVLTHYLDLKDALFNSNPDDASEAANRINNSLENIDMNLLQGDAHTQWMDFSGTIRDNTQAIASTDQIEAQRTAFIDLSSSLIDAVKAFEVPGVVYQQFCPMANNGEGATWLNQQEQIQNPFYGSDKMHDCGEIVQRIEF